MLAIERRNLILQKLQTERRVVVSSLALLYEVSEETIRRDLEKMEKEGLVVKSYGGAVINENNNLDLPFNVRKTRNVVGKQRMANIAAQMIHEGENIFLDASSTALAIARAIKHKKDITIITNSLEIAVEMADASNIRVISTGGEILGSSLALVGQLTDKAIRSYFTDKAFISCKAIDTEAGFTDSDERHAQNKRSMLEGARSKVLVVDQSKFGKFSFAKIGDWKDIDTIITDAKPDAFWLERLAANHIDCIYPE